ncbi:MAG: SUMF1/EgtB/PvdO family nonheme iron enzyme [bacterium]
MRIKFERKNKFMLFLVFATPMLYFICAKTPTTPTDPLQSIEIQASSHTIYSGGFLQLALVAKYRDGTNADVTSAAKWSTSPGTAGVVDDSGLFRATNDSVGIETIHAEYSGKTATIQIEVFKRAMVLSVWPNSATVQSGETMQFEAIAEYQDASVVYITDEVEWSVSPGLAATIDSTGKFHAEHGATGEESVICDYQTLEASATVHIQTTISVPFEMVVIPAGSFTMGSDNGRPDEKPPHVVVLDAFQIGKYEVTNAQYADYLNQALAADEIFVQSGLVVGKKGPYIWRPYALLKGVPQFPDVFIKLDEPEAVEYVPTTGSENLPVVRLTWYGAAAFCAFYGLRLPTEAEWEKAARGGQQLEYATQDGNISHDLANYNGTGGMDTFEGLAPVGTFPPNPYGIYDMSANAGEHVFDLYQWDYYTVSPAENPIGPGPNMFTGDLPFPGSAVWRGGCWFLGPDNCRTTSRFNLTSTQDDLNYLVGSMAGVRAARSVPQ